MRLRRFRELCSYSLIVKAVLLERNITFSNVISLGKSFKVACG